MGTKDIFDQAAISLSEHFEYQDGVYTPLVGSAVSCPLRLSQETFVSPDGMDAETWIQRKSVTVLLSDIGQETSFGDTFTIGGVVYSVMSAEPENNGRFIKAFVK